MVDVQHVGVHKTLLVHLVVGLAVLFELLALIEGIDSAVLAGENYAQTVLNIEGIGIIGPVQPVGGVLVLVEPVIGFDAGFLKDIVLTFLHQVQHVLHTVGGELLITNLFHNVGTQVHVGHGVLKAPPGAGHSVVVAGVDSAQPLVLGKAAHQVGILLQQVV